MGSTLIESNDLIYNLTLELSYVEQIKLDTGLFVYFGSNRLPITVDPGPRIRVRGVSYYRSCA